MLLGLPLLDVLLLAAAGFTAGTVNAVAGGGTFFSFGALSWVGLPPIVANATSAISVLPGQMATTFAYLKETKRDRKRLIPLAIVSGIGGLAGAWLLLQTEDAQFRQLVPWLLFAATGLFAFSPLIARWTQKIAQRQGEHGGKVGALVLVIQTLVAGYGGYFGAGMGIMMLASLALTEGDDFHKINAAKSILAIVIQTLAVILFIGGGIIAWEAALVVTVSAVAGGYLGVLVAQRVPVLYLRIFIITTGTLLGLWYLAG